MLTSSRNLTSITRIFIVSIIIIMIVVLLKPIHIQFLILIMFRKRL